MNTDSSPTIPRLESLHHRLKTVRGPDGSALSFLDDLMVFLEDPPPDVRDRWQAGADLCAAQGIPTSRMSVWRFYRKHVAQWRRENAPALGPVAEVSTAQLQKQAQQLVAVRTIETLHDPRLSPNVLLSLMQDESRRQRTQLAREKFNEELETKRRLERREHCEAIEKEARDQALSSFQKKSTRKSFDVLLEAAAAEREARAVSPPPEPGPLPIPPRPAP